VKTEVAVSVSHPRLSWLDGAPGRMQGGQIAELPYGLFSLLYEVIFASCGMARPAAEHFACKQVAASGKMDK
jgi:hypothetical protein